MQIVQIWASSAPPDAAVAHVDEMYRLAVLVSDAGLSAVPGR
jgi:hypothetical protein